ncbi:hypothetical protein AB3X55_05140 [Alphaproteobacteria bacterium LSUCC0719]
MMKRLVAISLMCGLMAGTARAAEDRVDYLLLWVIAGGDYVDSGFRFDAAGGCFAKAQNIASDMQYVGMGAPQFTCVPLKPGHEFNVSRQPRNGSRFPF